MCSRMSLRGASWFSAQRCAVVVVVAVAVVVVGVSVVVVVVVDAVVGRELVDVRSRCAATVGAGGLRCVGLGTPGGRGGRVPRGRQTAGSACAD